MPVLCSAPWCAALQAPKSFLMPILVSITFYWAKVQKVRHHADKSSVKTERKKKLSSKWRFCLENTRTQGSKRWCMLLQFMWKPEWYSQVDFIYRIRCKTLLSFEENLYSHYFVFFTTVMFSRHTLAGLAPCCWFCSANSNSQNGHASFFIFLMKAMIRSLTQSLLCENANTTQRHEAKNFISFCRWCF